MKHTLYIYTTGIAINILMMLCAACTNNTYDDPAEQDMLILTVRVDNTDPSVASRHLPFAGEDAMPHGVSPCKGGVPQRGEGVSSTRATPPSFTLTINTETRHYTLDADGTTLVPDPGEEPVYIARTATTASVLTYGSLFPPLQGGGAGLPAEGAPFLINNPHHPITGAAAGRPTLALALTPASAQVSIIVTDRLDGDKAVDGLDVTAIALSKPATDADTGNYLFDDTTDPANPVLEGTGTPPTLTTRGDGYSTPAQCVPTTVKATDLLFTIVYGGKTYPVYAAADYDFRPGTNHRFTVQIDNADDASIIAATIQPFAPGGDINAGTPVPEGYDLVIASANDLAAFRNRVNNGETNLRAQQVADIDLAGIQEWEPIGNYNAGNTTGTKFAGTYNGNGHTIKNMAIKGDYGNTSAGLFGTAGPGAILAGLRLENVDINCTAYCAGALAGDASGDSNKDIIISHCTAQGIVINKAYAAGGLTGYAGYAHLTHCHTQCTVTTTGGEAGGLTGNTLYATLVACSATGTGQISAGNNNGGAYAGGLTGIDGGSTIAFCRATQTANASGQYGSLAGGFIGYSNNSTISGCYATGGASGSTTSQGTFAGYIQHAIITHCHAIKGSGAADDTVGGGSSYKVSISTDPEQRYTTITASGIQPVNATSVTRKPGTGAIVLPPEPRTFSAADVWTNETLPRIIDNQ